MNEKKSKDNEQEYYIGIDGGTNSIGWTVTSARYNVLRQGRKSVVG